MLATSRLVINSIVSHGLFSNNDRDCYNWVKARRSEFSFTVDTYSLLFSVDSTYNWICGNWSDQGNEKRPFEVILIACVAHVEIRNI